MEILVLSRMLQVPIFVYQTAEEHGRFDPPSLACCTSLLLLMPPLFCSVKDIGAYRPYRAGVCGPGMWGCNTRSPSSK